MTAFCWRREALASFFVKIYHSGGCSPLHSARMVIAYKTHLSRLHIFSGEQAVAIFPLASSADEGKITKFPDRHLPCVSRLPFARKWLAMEAENIEDLASINVGTRQLKA